MWKAKIEQKKQKLLNSVEKRAQFVAEQICIVGVFTIYKSGLTVVRKPDGGFESLCRPNYSKFSDTR